MTRNDEYKQVKWSSWEKPRVPPLKIKIKWRQNIGRMEDMRLPKQVIIYSPQGRRDIGRPRKRDDGVSEVGTGCKPLPWRGVEEEEEDYLYKFIVPKYIAKHSSEPTLSSFFKAMRECLQGVYNMRINRLKTKSDEVSSARGSNYSSQIENWEKFNSSQGIQGI